MDIQKNSVPFKQGVHRVPHDNSVSPDLFGITVSHEVHDVIKGD